ncbi:hypothetical protein [Kribbella sp. NPDC023855]|uniref:hypothetical protein n=1 Tax=Kribbella sp. NPDC023855 TaxID=3154698 RepID=UPI0033F8390A
MRTVNEMLEVWAGWALGVHSKPLVILDPSRLSAPLRIQMEILHDHGLIPADVLNHPRWTETVRDVVDHLETEG